MIEINEGVVYVRGALNGAIYNFNNGKVYSIDKEACNIIDKLQCKSTLLTESEENYVALMKKNNLYESKFMIKKYIPNKRDNKQLKLVWLEVTQACNLKCLHCYEGESHISANETLSLTEWYKIIDELVKINVERVVVIGGEPCCNKDINNILLYLAQKNINTTLFTNGTLIDEELFEIIKKNKIKVKVSLYGHNADIHDRVTQIPGSFYKLIDNIKMLKDNNVTVDIAVVAMKENEEFQNEIREFIKLLNVNYYGYDVIRNVYGGTQNKHSPENIEIIKHAKFYEPSFSINKNKFDDNYYRNSCWYGKLVITEVGEVLPCVFERNISYGNIRSKSLQEIIDDKLLIANWFKDFSQISYCKDCEYRFACKDCRPLALSVNGEISDKNPRCLYNPYTGKWGSIYD